LVAKAYHTPISPPQAPSLLLSSIPSNKSSVVRLLIFELVFQIKNAIIPKRAFLLQEKLLEKRIGHPGRADV